MREYLLNQLEEIKKDITRTLESGKTINLDLVDSYNQMLRSIEDLDNQIEIYC